MIDNARNEVRNEKRAAVPSILVAVVLLAAAVIAEAQQPKKVLRIGYLSNNDPAFESTRSEAIRLALRELGYIEGQNIATEYRYAEGKRDRFPELAAELVRLKVDVIVTTGPTSTRAAKEATSMIPIVMSFDSDPVGSGYVASLAQPGGNITGLSSLAPELSGKQLELLKEVVPKMSRVAVLGTSNSGNAPASHVREPIVLPPNKKVSPKQRLLPLDRNLNPKTKLHRQIEQLRLTKKSLPPIAANQQHRKLQRILTTSNLV